MPLDQDIRVYIVDGGLGRAASGKDWYTGLLFQDATLPASYAADDRVKRIYSVAFAESLGITVALFPVAHYQISEFFRITDKFNFSAWIDIGFYAITTDAFDGTEIQLMQDYAKGELRQIGVFLVDAFASAFVTGANTVAASMSDDGYPTSVYLACDFADFSAPADLRALVAPWVSTIIGQDGGNDGAALFISEGYSIACIGAALAATAFANVHERIGWVGKFDVSGVLELQTLALCDGTLVETLTAVQIDDLNTKGYTLLLYRRVAGSYFYTDAVTASAGTSDFTEQRFNRTIGKAKRLLLEYLAPLQNMPLYVNASTGKMTEQTIGIFNAVSRDALGVLATKREISIDQSFGDIPLNSITIDPEQNVITSNKVIIGGKVVPVGTAGSIDFNLSFALST